MTPPIEVILDECGAGSGVSVESGGLAEVPRYVMAAAVADASSPRGIWNGHRESIGLLAMAPARLRDHRADMWAVLDAQSLLRCWNLNRWSQPTRLRIHAARQAVSDAYDAMRAELNERRER